MRIKQKFIMLLTIASLVIYIGLRLHYLLLHDVVNRHDTINANRHCKPLLCIFTTFKPGVYKIPVYVNTLRNWVSLADDKCRVKLMLYNTNTSGVDDYVLTELAQRFGWKIFQAPKVSTNGVPFVKNMYMDAAKRVPNCSYYMYSNGDILYSYDIIETLEEINKVLNGTVMVVGQRADIKVQNRILYRPESVQREVSSMKGPLHPGCGMDYFAVAGNRYPWNVVPDLAIGRPKYDNYLVMLASTNNVSVVDATKTLTALHQTDSDGVGAGHKRNDSFSNRKAIRRLHLLRGCWHAKCAVYMTVWSSETVKTSYSYYFGEQKQRRVLIERRTHSKNLVNV